ncbi:tyrosine-type recombinase/integrase [Metasolibacillus sp. FSL H7-0170]|uniref:tyrosine-type recombinase/integrase n=1 Tax=Metasolibacillus sp. FSL H7-0170 TaxID=2921431 RepID=UPI0031598DAA
MSKLYLIQEIETAVKMVANIEFDKVKLAYYLDDLLSNYKIEAKEIDMIQDDNEDYIHMYLSSLQVENYSMHTTKNYRYELQRFARQLNKPLLKATTVDIRQYLAAHQHLKTSTIVTKIDVLSAFYAWLVKEEELLKNPCLKIKRPKLPKKVRDGLTIIELEKVRAACADSRQRALIEVFYSTGCRLDELRKLDIKDIDWQHESAIVHGKGNKERRVYLSEKAQYYLKKYLDTRTDDCPALIATARRPIRRLTNEGIQYQIRKIKEASGIVKPLHPHIMRHTFAQLSLNAGMELADLQALLGHEKADTTARYAQISEERKQTAFRKYHMQ